MTDNLLSVRQCQQRYLKRSHTELALLDDVNFDIRRGEILGLIGRSGSGKSTLLRIVSGLIKPTQGEILWKGRALTEPTTDIGIVFQNFALFPWLTVEQNIALGLEAKRLPRAKTEQATGEIVDLLGLGGYENALPRELSDASQQRVSLARALVLSPQLLLMDEPFSELDMLTAENLRTDLIELWSEKKLPLEAMMIVTHDVEEAVLMCDRLLLFSSNPGRISKEFIIPFKHPRDRNEAAFRSLVDHIYTEMTRRLPPISEAILRDTSTEAQPNPFALSLPFLSVNTLAGLLETLASPPLHGRADLPLLAERLQMALDDLLPIGESLHLLELAELEDGDLILTEKGARFAHADHDERKDIFRASLLHRIPLIREIRTALDERSRHRVNAEQFRETLQKSMSVAYAKQTLQTAINWSRYAELFDFDEEADQFTLEAEHPSS